MALFRRSRRSLRPPSQRATASAAFLVGVATAIGAGVSMAFSEGSSDDSKVSGRGNSWVG